MTARELHANKDFSALFSDPRFVAVMTHARANFANSKDATGDEWRGWFNCIKFIESLGATPKAGVELAEHHQPYTKAAAKNP